VTEHATQRYDWGTADATNIGPTIHPHPTSAETVCFAAEITAGSIADL
jgi:dihydrolipoamide dehydrogenase